MAPDPIRHRRSERAAAQQRRANTPAMRAKYAGPFRPYLLKQLLIGLVFGLVGGLAVNWVWGLVCFVAVAGVGLFLRVDYIRRYGSTARSPGTGSPDD